MKTTMKRIFSLLIVLVMVCGMLPVVASAADGTWTLVKDASTLAVGDQIIIVAKNANSALSTTQSSNNRGQAAVTKSGDTVTFDSGVQVLTLEAGTKDGTFAFNVGTAGYLYAASSSNNYLRTQTTKNDNGSWKITIASTGVATIKAQGTYTRNLLRYNSSNKLFACYSSGQSDVAIYKLVVAGGDEGEHVHNYTWEITTAATCTTTGVKTYTCDVEDCDKPSYTEVIPATGHTLDEGTVTTAPTCTTAGVKTFTCSVCHTTTTEEIPALGHTLDEGAVTTAPTCTTAGVKTFTCSVCHTTTTEEIPATGVHNYVDGVCETCGDEQYSISFFVNGTVSETIPYVSGGIEMPKVSNSGSYTFAGWTDAAITTEGTDAPGTVYAAGQVVEFDAATTLYALYTRTERSTATEFVETTLDNIGTTDLFVIVGTKDAASYAMANDKGTSAAPTAVTITVANGKLTATPANNILWTLSKSGNSYTFHPNGDTSKWLYCTNTNNGVRVGTNTAKTFTLDGDYLKHEGTARYVGVYVTNPDWRCYTDTNGNIANQTFKFYAKPGDRTYYTTTIGCNHDYKGEVTTAATCTEDGVKTFTCSCGDSYTEAIPAIGHNYVLGEDNITYTCENCNDSYTVFNIHFSVPDGEEAVADKTYVDGGITLPAVNVSKEGYTFAGWAAQSVSNTDEAPTLYAAGDTFEATAETTLYAVYSYSVLAGDTAYSLLTDAASLTAGSKVILAANTKDVVATDLGGNKYLGYIAATFSADNTTLESVPETAIVLTVGGSTGAWTLANSEGKLLGVTAVKNLAWGSGTTTWTITVADGVTTLTSTNASYGSMKYNPSSPRFTTYASGQTAVQLYVEKEATTTFYTSAFVCIHQFDDGVVTTPATCNTTGVLTYTCSLCGDTHTKEIPALGHHDFTNGDCTCGHPAPDSTITIAEANQWGMTYEKDTYTTGKYYIEGTIKSIVNTEYGNMYIQDADGKELFIYGLYSADGKVRFDAMDPQPAVGDTIKIYTVIGTYDGKAAQAKSAWLAVDYVKKYNVELTDKIGMNFKLSADVTSATVTFNGETTTVDLTSLPIDKNGLRIYSLKMAAAQMTEEVTWLFNDKVEATYSVRGYADVVLSGEYGANVKALVRAMLHYGAAAQVYFDENTGDMANAGDIEDVTNTITDGTAMTVTGNTAGIVHYGSSLVYRDRVAVRVYFKLTGDAAIGDYTFTANGENAEVKEGSNGLYYVEIADIAPQNLDEAVTVVVNDGLTVTYSPLNYIYRMSNKTDDTALKTLLQQLYDYYMAAEYRVENGPDDFETEPDVVG